MPSGPISGGGIRGAEGVGVGRPSLILEGKLLRAYICSYVHCCSSSSDTPQCRAPTIQSLRITSMPPCPCVASLVGSITVSGFEVRL
jgi:hypothetical protein